MLDSRILLSALGAVLVSGGVLFVTICIYRLTFHPLANLDGEFLGKITDWSIVAHAKSGDRHIATWAGHEKYGGVIRIGPNTVSFNTATALKTINASRAANVQKADWYRTIDAGSKAPSVHSEIDKHRHAFRRRVLDQAFSETALKDAEPLLLSIIKTWLNALCPSPNAFDWSPPRDMKDWSNRLGFDVMGDLTFSKSFNTLTNDDNRFVFEVVLESTKFIYEAGFWPFISVIRPLFGTPIMPFIMSFFQKTSSEDNDAYVRYANAQMEERMAAEENRDVNAEPQRKDFVHYLLHARDPETNKALSIDELHADSSLLIHAGSDTTACTIGACLFYLLKNPPIFSKLQAQIRHAFPNFDSIRPGSTMSQLVYLRACIDETLRMCPPVPSHMPREVMEGGMEIDGQWFARGTVVGVAPWAIHHNEAYYPDPFVYSPERWIVHDGEGIEKDEQVKKAKMAFYAFGIGPRGCPGKRLAYVEVSLALCAVLWSTDMRLVESPGEQEVSRRRGKGVRQFEEIRSNENIYQVWDHFVADREGPVVEFRKREGVNW